MPGKDVKWPARRSMKKPGNDPTEDRTTRYYKPCGMRSSCGLLDRGLSRHEMPTRKRVRNKTPSSTRRKGSAREKVEIREGEDREHGLCPEGSTSKPRPRTLEIQAQEGLNRSRSVCFPPTPQKGLVAPRKNSRASSRDRYTTSSPEAQAIRPTRRCDT